MGSYHITLGAIVATKKSTQSNESASSAYIVDLKTELLLKALFTNEVYKLLKLINTNCHLNSVECAEINERIKDLTFTIAVKATIKQYHGEMQKNMSVLSLSLQANQPVTNNVNIDVEVATTKAKRSLILAEENEGECSTQHEEPSKLLAPTTKNKGKRQK
ncbi:unnamed protein product [Cuscuta epithymum]|uniref:Uncharacterized protein n=1 Tax=Cuscuta epithymum TaxID=186058 RepID=A0AAV0GCF3_9ASTE|nr:unnamed protein product [Cuscuta epithymum]CAH9145653.1 unnamed protein product [Cuscuta epithymum]